jgi:hypothetical protein
MEKSFWRVSQLAAISTFQPNLQLYLLTIISLLFESFSYILFP